MRIVIDLQAAQSTDSRHRGIGRYSLSLALAMVRNRGEHEILIALNGLLPEAIEPIRAAFDGLLPQENIRVWSAVAPVAANQGGNAWRRQTAELVREAFLAGLKPDVVHVSSLFEGYIDDAVTSVGILSRKFPTAVTLFDLIPYIHRKSYLQSPVVADWYQGKIEHLRRADLWLAISESSRREGIEHLGLPEAQSVNISSDADSHFRPLEIGAKEEQALREKYGLSRRFVMYTGGIDRRKNVEGLVRAFGKLPKSLRETHQLAIVCSVQETDRYTLGRLAAQHGLAEGDVVLTGFVSEHDLLALYNLCTLFVFPSLHEGFGLPALEAMRCGAPVIGAHTSSIPEVIGWEDALFDPQSDDAITEAIACALSDESYRAELVRRGKAQSAKFSWDETARRALAAMERIHAERRPVLEPENDTGRKPRLAYVSPLPPVKSGIADYSAELLPALARLYEIDVIVKQDAISDPWVIANCPIRSVEWFVENESRYERVLYHFGNNPFHQHMFDLLKSIPGAVVLHDFFLSNLAADMELHGLVPGYWSQELYRAHGFAALSERFHPKVLADVVWKYPCSLSLIQDSLGVIVHSPNSLRLAERWYGGDSSDWAVIPLLRDTRISADKEQARKALGIGTEAFLVCAFGLLGPSKLNHRLLQAWLKSRFARDSSCHLVFVGENHPSEYGQELLATIRASQMNQNIHITGWTAREVFQQYLAAADVGVQLRTLSRGETSAAVLDCMNYGMVTIVNANGSMADLKDEAVWKLPDEFSDEQLIEALETLWLDEGRRRRMGECARDIILRDHDPRVCADRYGDAIERFYRSAACGQLGLPSAISAIEGDAPGDEDLIPLADAIAQSLLPRNRQRQLLVDVSVLVQHDARSGVQRVVRSILRQWLEAPPEGYRVEPVYATVDQGYRYARRFTLDFLACPADVLQDEPIEYAPGDVFLALDLSHHVAIAQEGSLSAMHRAGTRVYFVVYDLLPLQFPDYWEASDGIPELHQRWLNVVTQYDGAVCISKAVADELRTWFREANPARQRPLTIDWFHLGADVGNSVPTQGLPADAQTVLKTLRSRTSFLMVGTLEPRKGHAQVLEALDQLWQSGVDVNLVNVGKGGWLVDSLVERLRSHPELNKRLFWLEGVSDEYLEKIYAASTCLIAASYGEGFGLPLIEAAQHKLPIIARDIPVFREVAGENAYYFDAAGSADDLAKAIEAWLTLFEAGRHPKSDDMPSLTWKESAAQLLAAVLPKPLDEAAR